MPTASVTPPPDAAAEIATRLVEAGATACVNRVPCQSVYRWEGGCLGRFLPWFGPRV